MKHTILYNILAVMVGMVMLGSCAGDIESPVATPVKEARFSLLLSLPVDPATRVPDSDSEYDDGRSVDYENYLDAEKMHILFFDTNKKFLYSFTSDPDNFIPVEGDVKTSKKWEIRGNLKDLRDPIQGGDFLVMAVANIPSLPAFAKGTSYDTVVKSLTYEYTATQGVPSKSAPIPMFGLLECKNVVFTDNMLTPLGTIPLLRAMAKIRVSCSIDDEAFKSITLHGYNPQGLVAPLQVYRQEDYTSGTYEADYVNHLSLAEGNPAAEGIPMQMQEDGSLVIYVPEFRNTTGDNPQRGDRHADAAYLEIVFDDCPEGESHILEFSIYKNGVPQANRYFDLQRNLYYQYDVSHRRYYDLQCKVFPYGSITLDPIFGIQR